MQKPFFLNRRASTKRMPFKTICALWLLPLLLLLLLPAASQAQFNYTTNNGTITITGYTGPGGAVTIPNTIDGLPVANIGNHAFRDWTNLTSVLIPNSVTSIGDDAFSHCTSLTNVMIGNSVTGIGFTAFFYCTNLTSVTIPNSVTSIRVGAFMACFSLASVTIPSSVTNIEIAPFSGCWSMNMITVDSLNLHYSSLNGVLFNKNQTELIECPGGKTGTYAIPNSVTSIRSYAFVACVNLTNVTIPNSVTNIEEGAFNSCANLTEVYCRGNAPSMGAYVFDFADNATIYYLPGTTGWGSTFAGRPTALWKPQMQTSDGSFGVRTNQFGFNAAWASGQAVMVEACTNLANPIWFPVQTNTLSTNGSFYFSDPQWMNYPGRFYRLRSP